MKLLVISHFNSTIFTPSPHNTTPHYTTQESYSLVAVSSCTSWPSRAMAWAQRHYSWTTTTSSPLLETKTLSTSATLAKAIMLMIKIASSSSFKVCLGFTLICTALPCLTLPSSVLHCIALPCLALSCLALPYLALSCLALPCLALPCLTLPCSVLHCIASPCFLTITLNAMTISSTLSACLTRHTPCIGWSTQTIHPNYYFIPFPSSSFLCFDLNTTLVLSYSVLSSPIPPYPILPHLILWLTLLCPILNSFHSFRWMVPNDCVRSSCAYLGVPHLHSLHLPTRNIQQ